MLRPEHIVRLKLDPRRLGAYLAMPQPAYVKKALTGQFNAIGEAIIGKLLNIDEELFKAQLDLARSFGTSFVYELPNLKRIGVSASVSLLKSGDVLAKNLIVPRSVVTAANAGLEDRIVIGAFVRGAVAHDELSSTENIEVAGWANTEDMQKWCVTQTPPTFHSKLPVRMMPCKMLRPIETLIDYVGSGKEVLV